MSIVHEPGTGWVIRQVPAWRRWWPTITLGAAVGIATVAALVAPGPLRLLAAGALIQAAVLIPVVAQSDKARALARAVRARVTGDRPHRRLVTPPERDVMVVVPLLVGISGAWVAARGPALPIEPGGPWLMQTALVLLAHAPWLVAVAVTARTQAETWARTRPDEVERLARKSLDAEIEETRKGVQDLWKRTIASRTWGAVDGKGGGGPLPGTKLTVRDRARDGSWHGRLDLGAGRRTIADAEKARELIGQVWDVPTGQVLVREGDTARWADIRVYKTDPLGDAIQWAGTTMSRSGEIDWGTYADGTTARSALWTPRGARHCRITGVTGSGKSSPSEVAAAELLLSRLGVVVVLDPDHGESLPWLSAQPGVLTARGLDECLEAVASLRALMEWRLRRGRPERPSRDRPLVRAIIEESPEILADKKAAEHVASLFKRGRKAWIGLTLVAQHYTAAELGGDTALRSQASGGDLFLFRQSEPISGPAAQSLPRGVAPHEIPEFTTGGRSTVGRGFAPGAGSSLPFRARFMGPESRLIYAELDGLLTEGLDGAEPSPPTALSRAAVDVMAEHWPGAASVAAPVEPEDADAAPGPVAAGEGVPREAEEVA